MGNLIPFAQRFIAGISSRTISARNLHTFLEVKRDFTTWIKARIEQYKFEENSDYIFCSPKRGSKIHGGHNSKDYYLTIDMAKELAMVERNEKGKQARRYFIDCEKQLLEKHKQASLPVIKEADPKRYLITLNSDKPDMYPIPTQCAVVTEENIERIISLLKPGYILVKREQMNAIEAGFKEILK